MEGHSIQFPVHVTVLMATVGIPVKVSNIRQSYRSTDKLLHNLVLNQLCVLKLDKWRLHVRECITNGM